MELVLFAGWPKLRALCPCGSQKWLPKGNGPLTLNGGYKSCWGWWSSANIETMGVFRPWPYRMWQSVYKCLDWWQLLSKLPTISPCSNACISLMPRIGNRMATLNPREKCKGSITGKTSSHPQPPGYQSHQRLIFIHQISSWHVSVPSWHHGKILKHFGFDCFSKFHTLSPRDRRRRPEPLLLPWARANL